MLDGISRPALRLSSIVRPSTNFQRRSSTGIGPAHAIAALSHFGEGMSGHTTRTSEVMVTQIDLGHTVAELADVGWELEASVLLELDRAPFDKLPAHELDRWQPAIRRPAFQPRI